jgi:hypothetical protein
LVEILENYSISDRSLKDLGIKVEGVPLELGKLYLFGF